VIWHLGQRRYSTAGEADHRATPEYAAPPGHVLACYAVPKCIFTAVLVHAGDWQARHWRLDDAGTAYWAGAVLFPPAGKACRV